MAKSMDEQVLISELVDRLLNMYPTLSRNEIIDVVHEVHESFRGAPLREFVPLFVERRAHSALGELAVSYA